MRFCIGWGRLEFSEEEAGFLHAPSNIHHKNPSTKGMHKREVVFSSRLQMGPL